MRKKSHILHFFFFVLTRLVLSLKRRFHVVCSRMSAFFVESLTWLIVLCQCVYEKRLYESPSDSAIRLIKREKSFRLLTSRFSSSWQKKKKKRKKDRGKRKKSERTREKENYERKKTQLRSVCEKRNYGILFREECEVVSSRKIWPSKCELLPHVFSNLEFLLLFFLFFFYLRQNEIVQNKNSF